VELLTFYHNMKLDCLACLKFSYFLEQINIKGNNDLKVYFIWYQVFCKLAAFPDSDIDFNHCINLQPISNYSLLMKKYLLDYIARKLMPLFC
jgi:hypothetical protein